MAFHISPIRTESGSTIGLLTRETRDWPAHDSAPSVILDCLWCGYDLPADTLESYCTEYCANRRMDYLADIAKASR